MINIAAEEAATRRDTKIDTLLMVDHRVLLPSAYGMRAQEAWQSAKDIALSSSIAPAELLRGQLITWLAVRNYIFAGDAVFTLVSLKTGMRFTYKARAKKADVVEADRLTANGREVEEGFVCYFVNLLRGPDNTADFAYLGVLRQPGRFFTTAKSQVSRHAAAWKALVWFLDQMKGERAVLGVSVEFWHSGRCGRCGRLLSVPKSVADGIGPECARYFTL